MEIQQVKVTPHGAEAILKMNTGNRKLRSSRVKQYAEQMKRGQWLESGDPIRISKSGVLLDGQHRLTAIVESGVSIDCVVISELDDEAYTVIDTGLGRKAADVVTHMGVQNAHTVAAIAKLVIGVRAGISPNDTAGMSLVTRVDIADFVKNNEDLVHNAAIIGNTMFKDAGGRATAWGALWIFALDAGRPTEASRFFEAVRSGANLSENDPSLALRNWIAKNCGRRQRNFNTGSQCGTFVMAFNDYVANKPRKVIRPWTAGKFPEVK